MVPELEPAGKRHRSSGTEPLRRKRVPAQPVVSAPRRRWLQYLIVFATLVLLAEAMVGERGLLERMRVSKEHQQASQALEALKRENSQLLQAVRRLRDDPSTIESLAREELGLIKPGELMFIIREVKPAQTTR